MKRTSSGHSFSSAPRSEPLLETAEGDPAHKANKSAWCRTDCSPVRNKQTSLLSLISINIYHNDSDAAVLFFPTYKHTNIVSTMEAVEDNLYTLFPSLNHSKKRDMAYWRAMFFNQSYTHRSHTHRLTAQTAPGS